MSQDSHFIVPLKYYVGTFIALLFLTFLTVFTAQFDFGGFINIVIALVIAITKASLVILFFMGIRWEKGISLVTLVVSIIFFLIFITFTLIDTEFRSYTDELEVNPINIQSPVKIIDKDSVKSH